MNSLTADNAQTVDCDLPMVMSDVCRNGSVLDFLMQTFMRCGFLMLGKEVISSWVRYKLQSN